MKTISLTENLKTINKIAEFENGWDGYDADAFSNEAIEYFIYVIKNLKVQPHITPTAANSIILKYTSQNGSTQFYNLGLDKTESVFLLNGDIREAETYTYSKGEDIITIINNDIRKLNI